MKKILFTIIALGAFAVPCVLFVGCEATDTPYGRGEIAGLGALVAFDTPEDAEKLSETRTEILLFLASDLSLTDAIIDRYAVKIAERYERNPAIVRIVLRKLKAEINLETGDARAKEFLQGVADALSLGIP